MKRKIIYTAALICCTSLMASPNRKAGSCEAFKATCQCKATPVNNDHNDISAGIAGKAAAATGYMPGYNIVLFN